MKILLITLMLLAITPTAYAVTITGSGNIQTFILDNQVMPINLLKAHTVSVYQRNTTNGNATLTISAGISINERQVLTVLHGVVGTIHKPDGVDEVEIFVQQGIGSSMAYYAAIVKYDEAHDLALLDIGNGPDMIKYPLLLGDPDGPLVTIGHPHGEQNTITTGTKGHINEGTDFTSLDMEVQPGNSGGGVINARGELVGLIRSTLDAIDNAAFMIGKDDIQQFLAS